MRNTISVGRVRNLSSAVPAVPESIGPARCEIAALAEAAGASAGQLEDIRLAVSEAITNVVQHAYDEPGGIVRITASVVAGELWILVADDGRGLSASREHRSAGLGLGMAWMAQFSDDLTLHNRSSGGLEVRLRFDLRPAHGDERAPEPSRPRVFAFG